MKIREVNLDDCSDLVDIHRRIDCTTNWLYGGPWVDDKFCREHIENAKKYGWVIFVAEVDGRVVGEIEIVPGEEPEPYGYNFHISLLYVHPEYSGIGIGKRLLQTGLSLAKECQADSITVVPSKTAEKLYQKFGFRHFESWKIYSLRLCFDSCLRVIDAKEINNISDDIIKKYSLQIGRYQSSKEIFDFIVRRTFSAMPKPKIFEFKDSIICIIGNKNRIAFCWGKSLKSCLVNLIKIMMILNVHEVKMLVRGNRGEIDIYRHFSSGKG